LLRWLGAGFDPAGAVPVYASVRIEVVLISLHRAKHQGNTIVGSWDDEFYRSGKAYYAVAAKTVPEQEGIVGIVLNIGG